MVMLMVAGTHNAAVATDFYVYYLRGQSNMDGYGYVNQLPAAQAESQNEVMIFHGNTSPDRASVDGKGIWAQLQPGHGVGFKSDGKTNQCKNVSPIGVSLLSSIRVAEPRSMLRPPEDLVAGSRTLRVPRGLTNTITFWRRSVMPMRMPTLTMMANQTV